MQSKEELISILSAICEHDSRYKLDAYPFILGALNYTMQRLKRKGHVSGKELSEGIRDYALSEYGRMAKTVLEHWGIKQTEDFGNIVFNMVDAGVLGKTKDDRIEDFKNIFDFKIVFEDEYIY
ncbi:MAG: Minf_1886 family protein [Candidatus Omnitrophota bacterium]